MVAAIIFEKESGFGDTLIGRLAAYSVLACDNKGNNKITELRTILQRESQNS